MHTLCIVHWLNISNRTSTEGYGHIASRQALWADLVGALWCMWSWLMFNIQSCRSRPWRLFAATCSFVTSIRQSWSSNQRATGNVRVVYPNEYSVFNVVLSNYMKEEFKIYIITLIYRDWWLIKKQNKIRDSFNEAREEHSYKHQRQFT